ncbi:MULTISPECIES: F0F1 ATP synthase subunit A [Fusobacterium]|uniref:F0F1 ATP synthase subunit A n=1 Tax=Fusobacterium TaxID=848 RepID=UPI001476F96A|nr:MULTISPECIES: F0F1 ATP synthase subunit A [Fusobacterium]NME36432.1 F0F1 ATP synthase subunit A [Fusobacterium sp. FSA-380-WT-3A]
MSVTFMTPPLVEGPKVVFYIPLPEFLDKFPLAMEMGNGKVGLPVSMTVVATWFCMFVLFLLFRLGTRKMELIPTSKLQIMLESLYNFLDGIITQMLGKWKKRYFSFISCLCLFIFTGNILMFFPIPWASFTEEGVVLAPAFRAPTADLNTTLGLALLTTIVFVGTNISQGGILGYLKGFTEPVPIMLPLNIIGELAKPVNMSFRLFGNMFAGMVILGLLYKVVPAVIPAPLHLYFDLFSGAVQSFVFTMLALVHIKGALGDSEPQLGQ